MARKTLAGSATGVADQLGRSAEPVCATAALPVAQRDRAVHDHDVDPDGILEGIFVRRLVDRRSTDRTRRRPPPCAARASAVAQVYARSGSAVILLIACSASGPSARARSGRGRAGNVEPARMRMPTARRSVDGERAAVAAHHSVRMRQNAREVVFAHREPDHADVCAVSLEQRDGRGVRSACCAARTRRAAALRPDDPRGSRRWRSSRSPTRRSARPWPAFPFEFDRLSPDHPGGPGMPRCFRLGSKRERDW